MASARPDLLALAAYAGVILLFFWRLAARGMVPLGYDLLAYFYPYKAYLFETVRQGEFPLWNPMIFMGAPLLANIQAAVLYPPDLLFYLLPTADALRYSTLLHLYLAATFTYLFGRVSLRLSPLAAWLVGAIFTLGGFIGARVGQPNQLHAAVWLPILLLCLERATTCRSRRAVALGAVAFAVQLLAGHTQELYYSGWAIGLFALYLALLGGELRHSSWPLGSVAAMVAVGAALAGVQLLPTLELARESYRSGGIPFGEAVTFSVPLKELLSSVLPLYSYTPYLEMIGYTGVVSLVLLPAAFAGRRRPGYQWYFLGLGLLALALSLGPGTRLYGWLYGVVPGFDLFRAPGRWLFLYGFSVAVLAGMAVESFRQPRDERGLRRWIGGYGLGLGAGVGLVVALRFWLGIQGEEFVWPSPRIVLHWALFAGAGVTAALTLCGWPRSRPAALLLVALVVGELYLAKDPLEYNRPVFASLYSSPRPIYSLLSADPSSRVLSVAKDQIALADEGSLRAALSPPLGKAEVDAYVGYTKLKEVLAPNIGLGLGIRNLDGYDGGLLPTRRYAQLKRILVDSPEEKPDHPIRSDAAKVPDSRLVGALGVSSLLVNRGIGGYDAGWQPVDPPDSGPVQLLRNGSALPRAFVVHRVRAVVGEDAELGALRREDLSQVVVLGEKVDYQEPALPGRDEVRMVQDRAGEVVVKSSTEQPGFLVLSDSYYPGWKAFLDGQEVPLLRADYALRSVQVGPGSHEIRFLYDPLSVKLGLAMSIVGLLLVLALLLPIDSLRRIPYN